MEQSNEVELPQPRSLGQEFSTFQPRRQPMEATDVPEIAEPTGVVATPLHCSALYTRKRQKRKAELKTIKFLYTSQ